MKDIPEKFLAVMAADSQLVTLLGVTADDPRIYLYYNGDAIITDGSDGLPAKPAYITYAMVGRPEDRGAVANPTYSFVIWARDQLVVEQVRDRLVNLFDKRTAVTTVRSIYGKVVQENDSFQEQPNFAGRTLHFRFGFLALSAVA